MEWFYYLYSDKTKLNWFLLEIALEYYDRIKRSPELASYREHNSEQQTAQYCAYYARRLQDSLLNYLRGRRKTVIFYREYAGDFYPHHDDELTILLSRMARETFDHMWYACKGCPQQCLDDYETISPLFDEYKD
jgi:hypothetical protein